ncbi:MAG: hypothetical protein QM764_23065 [Chitinophagaceae bacterium]
MKLLLLATFVCFIGNANAQYDEINKVFNRYFPANPFKNEFTTFFKKLKTEPALVNKVLTRRTDSTLFSFKGNHNHYEWEGFVFTDAEFILEEVPFNTNSVAYAADTIMQYKVICYCFGGATGLAIVKDALKNFDDTMEAYPYSDYITKNGTVVGIAYNYHYGSLAVSPITASWMKIDEDKSAFSITVRLKLKQNMLEFYQPSLKSQ